MSKKCHVQQPVHQGGFVPPRAVYFYIEIILVKFQILVFILVYSLHIILATLLVIPPNSFLVHPSLRRYTAVSRGNMESLFSLSPTMPTPNHSVMLPTSSSKLKINSRSCCQIFQHRAIAVICQLVFHIEQQPNQPGITHLHQGSLTAKPQIPSSPASTPKLPPAHTKTPQPIKQPPNPTSTPTSLTSQHSAHTLVILFTPYPAAKLRRAPGRAELISFLHSRRFCTCLLPFWLYFGFAPTHSFCTRRFCTHVGSALASFLHSRRFCTCVGTGGWTSGRLAVYPSRHLDVY